MQNTIHFYWIDTNRKKRGYANNYNLVVDYTKKTVRFFINSFYGYTQPNSMECYRKSDITNLKRFLLNSGFTEEKSDF